MAEVAVVGGGILGLLSARELLARGHRVSLFDMPQTRPPASWAGGGILSPLYPWRYPAALTALTEGALQAYQTLDDQLREAGFAGAGIHHCGMRVLDEADPSLALQWAADTGVSARQQGKDIWLPEVATLRNSRLLDGLRRWLVAAGVNLVEKEVHGIDVGARRRVVTDEGGFAADRILICAGAWSDALLRPLGIDLPLLPVKGQMLRYEGVNCPASVLLASGGYIIPRGDGSLLVGSTVEPGEDDQLPTRDGARALVELAARLWPALADHDPVAQWAGIRPGNERSIPWLGALPGLQGVFVACGHYRNGLVCAPRSAQLLADLISDRAPRLDPQPYALPGV